MEIGDRVVVTDLNSTAYNDGYEDLVGREGLILDIELPLVMVEIDGWPRAFLNSELERLTH